MKIPGIPPTYEKLMALPCNNPMDVILEKVCRRNLQYLYRLSDEDDIPYKKKKKNKRKSK